MGVCDTGTRIARSSSNSSHLSRARTLSLALFLCLSVCLSLPQTPRQGGYVASVAITRPEAPSQKGKVLRFFNPRRVYGTEVEARHFAAVLGLHSLSFDKVPAGGMAETGERAAMIKSDRASPAKCQRTTCLAHSFVLILAHTHTRAHTHAHTHTHGRTHTHTYGRTHTHMCSISRLHYAAFA